MTKPISTATAEQYPWGIGCMGWHLVATDALSIIQEHMPADRAEARHLHVWSRQFFYVLEGELELEVDGIVHTLSPGVGMEIDPGVGHQAFNRSAEPVSFLVISQPPSHGDRQVLAPPE